MISKVGFISKNQVNNKQSLNFKGIAVIKDVSKVSMDDMNYLDDCFVTNVNLHNAKKIGSWAGATHMKIAEKTMPNYLERIAGKGNYKYISDSKIKKNPLSEQEIFQKIVRKLVNKQKTKVQA